MIDFFCSMQLFYHPHFPTGCPDSPFVPGYDFSGVIESVSDDVTDFSAGDEVFSCHFGKGVHADEFGNAAGAFAEYILMPVAQLSRKPTSVTHDQAAALACVGTTAERAMQQAKVAAGHKVLVLGGSTAVGSLAIQLAKQRGKRI